MEDTGMLVATLAEAQVRKPALLRQRQSRVHRQREELLANGCQLLPTVATTAPPASAGRSHGSDCLQAALDTKCHLSCDDGGSCISSAGEEESANEYSSSCGHSGPVSAPSSSSDSCHQVVEPVLVEAPDLCWEFPLSTAEKQERVLLLFNKEVAWASGQLRQGERLAVNLRKKVSSLRGNRARLRREVHALRKDLIAVTTENEQLRDQNSETQRLHDEFQAKQQHLEQEKQQLADAWRQLERQRRLHESRRQAEQQRHLAQSRWTDAPRRHSPLLPEAAISNASLLPCGSPPASPSKAVCMKGSSKLTAEAIYSSEDAIYSTASPVRVRKHRATLAESSHANVSRTASVQATCMAIQRSRLQLRGQVAVVSWSDGPRVTWVEIVSRHSGQPRLYGERPGDCAPVEECSFSLRRGEYVRSVSGWHGLPPELARCLQIATSEGRKVVAGSPPEGADRDNIDFCFVADPGCEILGFELGEGGVIIGVRQVPMLPSRVPQESSDVMSPLASRWGRAASAGQQPGRLSAPGGMMEPPSWWAVSRFGDMICGGGRWRQEAPVSCDAGP